MAIGGHHSPTPDSMACVTPPDLIEALGPFDLDPCASIKGRRPWPTASQHYTIIEDGLQYSWHGRFVWLNPPYGRETGKWVRKLARHGNGLALLFARTETRIFFPWVWSYAAMVFFLKGRLHFYRGDGTRAKGNAGAPSVLVAYGKEACLRLRLFQWPGRMVILR